MKIQNITILLPPIPQIRIKDLRSVSSVGLVKIEKHRPYNASEPVRLEAHSPLVLNSRKVVERAAAVPSSAHSTILDPVVSTKHTHLRARLEKLLDHLIVSNRGKDPYLDAFFASGRNLSIALADSNAVNACCISSLGSVFVNHGAYRKAKEEFGELDSIQWILGIISHEIGHVVYEEALRDSSRKVTQVAMEYMCDKIGANLFHRAGGDPKYLTFSPLGEVDSKKGSSIPGVSTHPGHDERERELEDIVVNTIYNINRPVPELLSQALTEQEINDIEQVETKYEFVNRFDSLSSHDRERIEVAILRCCQRMQSMDVHNRKVTNEQYDQLKNEITETIQEVKCDVKTRALMRMVFLGMLNKFYYESDDNTSHLDPFRQLEELTQFKSIKALMDVLGHLPSLIELKYQGFSGDYGISIFTDGLGKALRAILEKSTVSGPKSTQLAFQLCDLLEFNGIQLEAWDETSKGKKEQDYKEALEYRNVDELERKISYQHSPALVNAFAALDVRSAQKVMRNMSERNIALIVRDFDGRKLVKFTKNDYLARQFAQRFSIERIIEKIKTAKSSEDITFWIERLSDLGTGSTNDLQPDLIRDNLQEISKRIRTVLSNKEDIPAKERLISILSNTFQLSWAKRIDPRPRLSDIHTLASSFPNFQVDRQSPLRGVFANLDMSSILKIAKDINRGLTPKNSSKEILRRRVADSLGNQITLDPENRLDAQVNYCEGGQYKKTGFVAQYSDDFLTAQYNKGLNGLVVSNIDVYRALVAVSDAPNQMALFDKYVALSGDSVDEHMIGLFVDLMERTRGVKVVLREDQEKPLLSEGIGTGKQWAKWAEEAEHQISARDYLYFRFFGQHWGEFSQRSDEDILRWFDDNYGFKSAYRDVVLNKLYNHGRFATISDLKLRKQILDLYRDPARAVNMMNIYLQDSLAAAKTLDEKIEVIKEVLPYPTEDRDRLLEKVFAEHPFSIADLKDKFAGLFSYSSISVERDEKAFDSTLESIISRTQPEEKTEVILWLSGIKEELPSTLKKLEKKHGVDLRELRALFKFEGLRGKALEQAFAASNGLFAHRDELHKFLDECLGRFFVLDKPDNLTPLDKLKNIIKIALYASFDSESTIKKLRIIKNLFSKLSESEIDQMDFGDLCQVYLSSIGPFGIKLSQIISSQPEIQSLFPNITQKLSTLKDEAPEITMYELEMAVETNPKLLGKQIIFEGTLGSASMATTKRATVDGERLVAKIRRIDADKSLDIEEEDYKRLMGELLPLLNQYFGIENIPDYSERIFEDIKEEANLANEAKNAVKLRQVAKQFNKANPSLQVTVDVPEVRDYSNEVIMFETEADGESYDTWLESCGDATVQQRVQLAISRFFLYSVPRFFHVDPHSGNIFIKILDDGNTKVTFIDTGLCQSSPDIDERLQGLISNPDFYKLISSLDSADWQVISSIIQDQDLIQGIRDKFKKATSLFAKMQLIPSVISIINEKLGADNVLKSSGKLIQFFTLLYKHDLLSIEMNNVEGLSYGNLIKIVQKCSEAGSSNIPLKIISELDKLPNYKTPKFVLRLLLALSKTPDTLAYIKEDPRRAVQEILLSMSSQSALSNS